MEVVSNSDTKLLFGSGLLPEIIEGGWYRTQNPTELFCISRDVSSEAIE